MRLLKPSNNFSRIALYSCDEKKQAFSILGPKAWVWLITIKKQLNIKKITQKLKENLKKWFLKDVWVLKMIHWWFQIRFWIHWNNFFPKGLQMHFFSSSFNHAIQEKYVVLFFSNPNVEHILTWNQACLWSWKICRTKFCYTLRYGL